VEGKIWREKTNIRLQNHQLAIQNLKPIAKSLNFRNKLYPLANATVAEAFINLKELDSATYYMKRAALAAPKRKLKARYLFITGQLFETLEQQDSAQWAYEEITDLKRKAARKFYINAKIKQTLLDTTTLVEDRIERIGRLMNNYENEAFEHVLNRSLGSLYLKENQDSLALVYFTRSLESPSIDSYTQIENYQDLADYYFSKGDYLKTGEYLEKLLPLFDNTSVAYKKLKRKKDNLSEVVAYEKTIQSTDSLLSLLSLSQKEQEQFFQNFIDEQQAIAEKTLENQSKKRQFLSQDKPQNAFYFYNPKVVLQGRQTYKANWGNRPNVDNWRQTASLQTTLTNSTQDSELS
jgi:tetratricopeptide (TPR) repeat protein